MILSPDQTTRTILPDPNMSNRHMFYHPLPHHNKFTRHFRYLMKRSYDPSYTIRPNYTQRMVLSPPMPCRTTRESRNAFWDVGAYAVPCYGLWIYVSVCCLCARAVALSSSLPDVPAWASMSSASRSSAYVSPSRLIPSCCFQSRWQSQT